jgi:hypothetical protein
MSKDSFLRCYVEAWVYWIGLNLAGSLIGWLTVSLLNLPTISYSQLSLMFEPFSLIAQGMLLIPLFAAILVGIRRSTGRSE